MLKIGFFSVEDSSTTSISACASAGVRADCFLRRTWAEPTCYMQMLRTLVSFPVCFTAEGFCAVGECTAVGSFVTFLMFFHFTAETGSFGTNRALESTF